MAIGKGTNKLNKNEVAFRVPAARRSAAVTAIAPKSGAMPVNMVRADSSD